MKDWRSVALLPVAGRSSKIGPQIVSLAEDVGEGEGAPGVAVKVALGA